MLRRRKYIMKRLVAITLCFCLFITGCSKGNKVVNEKDTQDENIIQEDTAKDPEKVTEEDAEDPDNDPKANKPHLLQLNKEWSAVTLVGVQQPDFIMPSFESKVDPYVINEDLSNIDNIDRFPGFTKDQKKMLAENGFVVLPSNDSRMYYVYDSNEYLAVPNFITSDSVLHLYHQFYNKSLMYVESNYLYDYLDHLTRQMLDNSIKLMDALEDQDLKLLQEKNIVYFLVARMLMLNTWDLNVEVREDLLRIAKEEYQLIEQSGGYIKSPLLDFDMDYSQFTIRGHYTRSDELGRFFRTMMWFGIAPLPFANDEGNIIYENILQSLLMSYTTFLDTDFISNAELWNNIYQPTEQYVGVSDDINVFTMNGLRLNVFGDNEDPNILNDKEFYDKLIEEVGKLPEPRIQGKLVTVSTPTNKQFRYMGQRYILDSFIMQNLVEPYLRPLPSALDTMGVLGSEYAEELLFNYYKPHEDWPKYEEKYFELKDTIAGYGVDIWGENLYNGWLWTIKENLTEYDKASGMPYFMTNDAWRAKSLNASLASYTELKHDTVLYGKQSTAEMGGGIEYEQAKYHYVEPNVYLYSKLLYLTEHTMQVLRERDMLSTNLEDAAIKYQELLQLLIDCSIKELRNEKLTDEEYYKLLYYGGKMEDISNAFVYVLMDEDGEMELDISDMLVTDVASSTGYYLSLGTGNFDYIYVVVPVEDKLYLSRGSVYSSYEFISDSRLTDEEWWELNGIKLMRGEYGDYPEYTGPSDKLPKQADWIKAFKSLEENKIDIEQIEVDWSLLSE